MKALLALALIPGCASANDVAIAQAQAAIEAAKAAQESATATQIAVATQGMVAMLLAIVVLLLLLVVFLGIYTVMLRTRMQQQVKASPAPGRWLPGPNARWGRSQLTNAQDELFRQAMIEHYLRDQAAKLNQALTPPGLEPPTEEDGWEWIRQNNEP